MIATNPSVITADLLWLQLLARLVHHSLLERSKFKVRYFPTRIDYIYFDGQFIIPSVISFQFDCSVERNMLLELELNRSTCV